jgi:hypothetical protein
MIHGNRMEVEAGAFPGMTEYRPESIAHIRHSEYRPKRTLVVALTTPLITRATLYNNGLYQNILILYKLVASLGHTPYLIVTNEPTPETADLLLEDGYTCISPEGVIRNGLSIDVHIEVGMAVDSKFTRYLRTKGTRLVKYYLGNIINIDVEIITTVQSVSFPHHCPGTLDELWTSPHYAQNIDYMCSLYRLPFTKGIIAPYVWEPMFLDTRGLKAPRTEEQAWITRDLVITEPNISFQKSCLPPLLLAERFAKAYPAWRGRVILMNSHRFATNTHAKAVLESLALHRAGRILYRGRQTIREIMEQNSGACFICHQVNNEYNYMVLELMYSGFPVLHNASVWSAFGYYWSDDAFDSAVVKLYSVLQTHEPDGIYRADGRQLAWLYSIYNPVVREAWGQLLDGGGEDA